jgi:hypothetical protein
VPGSPGREACDKQRHTDDHADTTKDEVSHTPVIGWGSGQLKSSREWWSGIVLIGAHVGLSWELRRLE